MVLSILSKITMEYSFFISTFHSVRLTSGATWEIPFIEAFIESLTQKKTDLNNMGKIKGSKVHALDVKDGSSHQDLKSKNKYKGKGHANSKKEVYSRPFNDSSRSKGGKERKGDTCTY